MSSERWERIKEILEQALPQAPERRVAYLDLACGPDAQMRAEVESLIAHHEEAGSQFLTVRVQGTPSFPRFRPEPLPGPADVLKALGRRAEREGQEPRRR